MLQMTKTLFLFTVSSAIIVGLGNSVKAEKKQRVKLAEGDISESYTYVSMDGFQIELLSTSVKTDVLTLHLSVTNKQPTERLFDAFVLNVKNTEGKTLAISPVESLSKTVFPNETVQGIVSYQAAGKGPFIVEYDNLEDVPQALWTIAR